MLATVTELRERGVTVVSLTENFDLGTKEGRLMFGVLALAAEYELELRAKEHGRERPCQRSPGPGGRYSSAAVRAARVVLAQCEQCYGPESPEALADARTMAAACLKAGRPADA